MSKKLNRAELSGDWLACLILPLPDRYDRSCPGGLPYDHGWTPNESRNV